MATILIPISDTVYALRDERENGLAGKDYSTFKILQEIRVVCIGDKPMTAENIRNAIEVSNGINPLRPVPSTTIFDKQDKIIESQDQHHYNMTSKKLNGLVDDNNKTISASADDVTTYASVIVDMCENKFIKAMNHIDLAVASMVITYLSTIPLKGKLTIRDKNKIKKMQLLIDYDMIDVDDIPDHMIKHLKITTPKTPEPVGIPNYFENETASNITLKSSNASPLKYCDDSSEYSNNNDPTKILKMVSGPPSSIDTEALLRRRRMQQNK